MLCASCKGLLANCEAPIYVDGPFGKLSLLVKVLLFVCERFFLGFERGREIWLFL